MLFCLKLQTCTEQKKEVVYLVYMTTTYFDKLFKAKKRVSCIFSHFWQISTRITFPTLPCKCIETLKGKVNSERLLHRSWMEWKGHNCTMYEKHTRFVKFLEKLLTSGSNRFVRDEALPGEMECRELSRDQDWFKNLLHTTKWIACAVYCILYSTIVLVWPPLEGYFVICSAWVSWFLVFKAEINNSPAESKIQPLYSIKLSSKERLKTNEIWIFNDF